LLPSTPHINFIIPIKKIKKKIKRRDENMSGGVYKKKSI
jgi:hypothetical protein